MTLTAASAAVAVVAQLHLVCGRLQVTLVRGRLVNWLVRSPLIQRLSSINCCAIAARISLGGSLDTATRQLMEAREAVKKLEGDRCRSLLTASVSFVCQYLIVSLRTMSKLRITARSLYQVAFHGNLEKVVLLLCKC